MKSDSHRIRNRVTKQEKNSEKELYMQTLQNFLDDWIISNITVKGKSSFLFLQRGKWLVILEKQTKGNGIFFLPTKSQINTKHLTLQGPELGPGRRHILKQLLELQNVPICEAMGWWIKLFSARDTPSIFCHWIWPCIRSGTFTSLTTTHLAL